MKFATIDLWEVANVTNLKKFDTALKKTHLQIETTSILLEEIHYAELVKVIINLQEYDMGKEKLIAARRETASEYEIQRIIDFNRTKKDKCLKIIESMKSSIKETIKGKELA